MTATVTKTGQNNWQYRTGYQRTQRVSMPIQPMQDARKWWRK